MSRISDMIIDIQENLDENLTDKQIAEKVGCPENWVKEEREKALEDLFNQV